MNSVNIMGRMVADAELRKTDSNKSVCSFRIAVDAGKDKKSYFFSVTAWNATAENIAKYFHKGDKIAISGLLTSRNYEDKEGKKRTAIEILANSFDFCDSKKNTVQDDEPMYEVEPLPPETAEAEPAGDLPFKI